MAVAERVVAVRAGVRAVVGRAGAVAVALAERAVAVRGVVEKVGVARAEGSGGGGEGGGEGAAVRGVARAAAVTAVAMGVVAGEELVEERGGTFRLGRLELARRFLLCHLGRAHRRLQRIELAERLMRAALRFGKLPCLQSKTRSYPCVARGPGGQARATRRDGPPDLKPEPRARAPTCHRRPRSPRRPRILKMHSRRRSGGRPIVARIALACVR